MTQPPINSAAAFPGHRQRCAACGAEFVWLADARTGAVFAVDPEPAPGGEIDAELGRARFWRRTPHPARPAHRFHRETCTGYPVSERLAAEVRAANAPPVTKQ